MVPRSVLIALYALGALAVGIWSDLAFAGRTDLLRDPISTAITLVFGAIVGDIAVSVEQRIFARRSLWPVAKPLFILRVITGSIGWLLLGHLLTPAVAMLVQIPRAGFEILPTIALGLEFVLRQALLPVSVVGSGIGLAVGAAFVRGASTQARA